ncbi:MAG TPA: V-type ATP synthase subunit I [Caldisericia bacterium]|nr:V-type ATP synthase subunit I [Caldisericia bacterium]HPF48538.1 V-type ATP synthase subunit I [Caldisericia bacterium]HPI84592.1 V-type ATP synthase subunit I [Caldisericia bacterium]HPQ92993.1 V-type ATP synthase subunit I [Caldisericia bacterium]HRV75173.1 V-type ATP synthase subunit I [Caldisericia bacterium]
MKKALVATPRDREKATFQTLVELGTLHIRRLDGTKPVVESEDESSLLLSHSIKAHDRLQKFFPEKLPFVANFFWPRPRMTKERYQDALSEIDIHNFVDRFLELSKEYDHGQDTILRLSSEIQLLQRFKSLPIPTKLDPTDGIEFMLGTIPRRNIKDALKLNKSPDCAVTKYGANIVLLACAKGNSPNYKTTLHKLGLEALPIPSSDKSPSMQIEEINDKINSIKTRASEILTNIKSEFLPHKTALLAHIDNLELAREHKRFMNQGLSTDHATVFLGYIPEAKTSDLVKALKQSSDELLVQIDDIPNGEEPPVILKNNAYSKQFEMLSGMYSLPAYRGIDSTPIVSLIFPIFFGFCFGDVLYGLMLLFFSLWFGRLYKHEESARKFFGTFLISSIFVIVIGALTGAWGGNLVGETGIITWAPLINFKNSIALIDPINQTIPFFVLTLYIGIGTQFLGIIYKAWQHIKNREWHMALLDSGGWILFLSGLTLFAINFLTPGGISKTLTTIMYTILGVGALFLIISQGRDAKSIAGRLGVGVISLYGILGGYGTTAYLSDVMSYSRLLALGLTTSIVAQAFNAIAGGFDTTNAVGIMVCVAILIVGHLFNFFLNIVGSFVHPARLIFLEFYSRFYESGGKKYNPVSERHIRINVTDEAA